MGFQMSVMCIGQLAMQTVVNSLGTAAVAGYTAASKADQLSVLVNNAMMTAISNYVAQNFGAGQLGPDPSGCPREPDPDGDIQPAHVRGDSSCCVIRSCDCFCQCLRQEIYHYSDMYLTIVAPFYVLLGLLAVYRTSIQSMQNGSAPFAACMIELVMRLAATVWSVSESWDIRRSASPARMAWFGACALLIPCYYRMMRKWKVKSV